MHRLNALACLYALACLLAAPEMLVNDKGHGRSVDVWAYGVLLYIMLTQEPPFYDENRSEMFNQIKTAEPYWPKEFSPESESLIRAVRFLPDLAASSHRYNATHVHTRHSYWSRTCLVALVAASAGSRRSRSTRSSRASTGTTC